MPPACLMGILADAWSFLDELRGMCMAWTNQLTPSVSQASSDFFYQPASTEVCCSFMLHVVAIVGLVQCVFCRCEACWHAQVHACVMLTSLIEPMFK
jgi:hypothetical protein